MRLQVTLNGTDRNLWHRYGLTQNPFPQIAKAELSNAMRQLNSLDGDPLSGQDDIRSRLNGWSDEFIQLCADNFRLGERKTFVVVIGSQ